MVFDGKITTSILRRALHQYGIYLTGLTWRNDEVYAAYRAASSVGSAMAESRGNDETAAEAFSHVFGTDTTKMVFENVSSGTCYGKAFDQGGCTQDAHLIQFASLLPYTRSGMGSNERNFVHEIFHAFSAKSGAIRTVNPEQIAQ